MKCLLISLVVLSASSTTVLAKTWRGITPLASTRADVERVLGPPTSTSNNWSTYHSSEETVSIFYSNGLPCGRGANSDWQLPQGIVVSITVAPRTIVLFSELNVDESKFQKLKDAHRVGSVHYWNKTDGEEISVANGEVTSFRYVADSAETHLRCSKAPVGEQTEKQTAQKLDAYRNLRFKDEKIRLDNFAINMEQAADSVGYIVAYSGLDIAPTTARARARRAREYLVKVRGIKSTRLTTIYGGRRTDFIVELYIGPRGSLVELYLLPPNKN